MARTNIPIQDLPKYGASLDDLSWTAADATNDHSFVNNGNTILLYRNEDSSQHTADIIGVANSRTYNQAPSETMTASSSDNLCMAGPFAPGAFNQTDGTCNVDLTDDTSQSFAAVKFDYSP